MINHTVTPTNPAPIPALLTKRLIRRHYLPVGERTLDRWISSGTFPRPDKSLGGKVRLWLRETVELWVRSNSAPAT